MLVGLLWGVEDGILKIYLSLNSGIAWCSKDRVFSNLLSCLGFISLSVSSWEHQQIPLGFLKLVAGGNGYRSGISLLALLNKAGGEGELHFNFLLTFVDCPYYNLQRVIETLLLRYLRPGGPFKLCIGWSKCETKYFVFLYLSEGLKSSMFWFLDMIFKENQFLFDNILLVECVDDPAYCIQYIKESSIPRTFIFYDSSLDMGY